MFNNYTKALEQVIASMQANALLALQIIAILWLVQVLNYLLHYRLNALGLVPRTPSGLLGILFSPFLHGNATHLFFNSIPLFLLLSLMLNQGLEPLLLITLNIMLMSGVATWVLGRRAVHIGSSGVIMGYMGYLLLQAIFHPTPAAVILGLLALYYCSSILLHLLPSGETTSWEGHVFGFAAGLCVAYGWIIIPI